MEFHYRYGEDIFTINLEPQPDGNYQAVIGDSVYHVTVQRSQRGQLNLLINGQRLHFYADNCELCQVETELRYVALVDRQAEIYELEKVATATRRSTGGAASGELSAQMPGQIMEVMVSQGDAVEQGQTLLIMEAMKMELRVSAPFDGTVSQLFVAAGDTVDRGQNLIEVSENN